MASVVARGGQVNPYWQLNGAKLYQGHVLDKLGLLAAQSVQCAITSPPYWGLRDYGLPSLEWPAVRYKMLPFELNEATIAATWDRFCAGLGAMWHGLLMEQRRVIFQAFVSSLSSEIEIPGCDLECEHVWGEERIVKSTLGATLGGPASTLTGSQVYGENVREQSETTSQGQYCQLCGGWRGCLGLEPTVEMFVGHIVLVARALWRVLRDDGVCWLNLGDSYASGEIGRHDSVQGREIDGRPVTAKATERQQGTPRTGLPTKNLLGVPWRVAFALQADGWYLRSDIIWAKGVSFCPTYSGSCMPESVRDRPTKGHEYVLLLAKSARYYYDGDAVREEAEYGRRSAFRSENYINNRAFENSSSVPGGTISGSDPSAGRNLRTVWTINPGSYAGAHFATFPPALVEPMIKAGTSAKGCCPECGAPWERVTEKTVNWPDKRNGTGTNLDRNDGGMACNAERTVTTTGWRPTCTCNAGDPVPCTVLDPFAGSGTTILEAVRFGRRAIGIELSQPYCDEHIIPRLEAPLQLEMSLA